MSIRFDGRVAIVTGAGGGLGRLHALALAQRGAAVVVNDLGGTLDGNGGTPTAANAVVEEIRAAGGKAIASAASVTDFAAVEAMVQAAVGEWGRVDILVNNAGILRDKSFAKMEVDDFRLVLDVHLMGAVHCTKAVWEVMREQKYGRIVMTTSSTGPLRQLRPVELRRRQDGAGGADADALARRREVRHPRQLPGTDGGDADDRRADARGRC
jgi:NAD(P)-dependent dehydrogenase (short-subunit alcohol dehydrogenase family)